MVRRTSSKETSGGYSGRIPVFLNASTAFTILADFICTQCWEAWTWHLCDLASLVQLYQQPTRCSKFCFIDSFNLALHVSSDSFAHLQGHFDCTYSFLEQCTDSAVCCRPVTQIGWNHPKCVTGRQQTAESVHCSKKLYIQSKSSWKWAKLSPETCIASLKESIKQNLLHLVVSDIIVSSEAIFPW